MSQESLEIGESLDGRTSTSTLARGLLLTVSETAKFTVLYIEMVAIGTATSTSLRRPNDSTRPLGP